MRTSFFVAIGVLALAACCPKGSTDTGYEANGRWTKQKAREWSERTGWRSGCNYLPATAINQIEMWQASTFDPETIDKELGWAEELGFNTMRVYLSSVVWKHEADSFKQRIGRFLEIADSHGISPVFVFFDDCWNPASEIGPQPAPKPGIHNSGWVRDPADNLRADTVALFPVLEAYMRDIMTAFRDDGRVLCWDLYNEPGNNGYNNLSLPLLRNSFRWAHGVRPSQPVTAGLWNFSQHELNECMVDNSDVISYHDYTNLQSHSIRVGILKALGRPLYCTEYMARKFDSKFQNIMPMLKANNIGAINWGFVAGKSNTIFAWSEPMPDAAEPPVWFHDIYRQDKTPFDPAEIEAIKQINGK